MPSDSASSTTYSSKRRAVKCWRLKVRDLECYQSCSYGMSSKLPWERPNSHQGIYAITKPPNYDTHIRNTVTIQTSSTSIGSSHSMFARSRRQEMDSSSLLHHATYISSLLDLSYCRTSNIATSCPLKGKTIRESRTSTAMGDRGRSRQWIQPGSDSIIPG